MNSFGTSFRVTIWGESHGRQVGVSIDGVRSGISLTESDFEQDLLRRRAGAKGTTPRVESDIPHIVSGVYENHTTGAPLTIVFNNENTRSGDYSNLISQPRPSHADFVANELTNGMNDPRGGGHFSGRLTLGLVAAGVVAKRMLGSDVAISSQIVEIGGESDKAKFDAVISSAMADGDSVGGVIECRVSGVELGFGLPFFDSAESVISHLLFAIPAVKGVEFGDGFAGAKKRGSERNDCYTTARGNTSTNNEGGINGGITNGSDIVLRVAIKPTASISKEQMTFDKSKGAVSPLRIAGRHDACIALRAGVVVEAAVAIALADLIERKIR